jgi:hypothetical protein
MVASVSDLLDEAVNAGMEKVVSATVGGDLLDEASLKNKDPSMLSDGFKRHQSALLDKLFALENDEAKRRRQQSDIERTNANIGDVEQFFIMAGRGLTNVGRGFGLAEQEPEGVKKPLSALNEGEIIGDVGQAVGEAAPFVPAYMATGGMGLAPRVLASGAIGATEGGTVARGRGGTREEISQSAGIGGALASTSELLFGVLGRIGSRLFRQIGKRQRGPLITPDGKPSKEFQQVLEETGTSFDDLVGQAQDFIARAPDGTNPAQAARKARFDSLGIPATKGDITQDFGQQALESRLVTSMDDSAAPLRSLRRQQSNEFQKAVDGLISDLGMPDEAGISVKTALTAEKSVRKAEKNRLYKELFEASPELESVPLFSQNIKEAIPDQRELRRLKRISGSQVDAMEDLLVEFGVVQDDALVKKFAESGGEITPLSMGNFEEFRQAINQIERADQTGAVQVFSGPIKSALDSELDVVEDVATKAGMDDAAVSLAKRARSVTRGLKEDYSPQALAGRLIETKKDGITPLIESSQINKTLFAKSTPVEQLEKTVSLLNKAEGGKRAIGNLQAAAVFQALEDSLKATGRKVDGELLVSGSQFSKSLRNIGEDKLKVLFAKNPSQLKKLMNLKQTGLDIQASNDAVPKGSAPVIMDIMRRAGRLPGVAAVVDAANFIVSAGADDRAVRRALKADPDFKRTATMIEQEFPALASALGIAGVTAAAREDDDGNTI